VVLPLVDAEPGRGHLERARIEEGERRPAADSIDVILTF
jgi:hypothetical protein